jgi:hypothetical protein
MFFGLTNSPVTFQMMMNTIFHIEVAQGWLSVYMDNLAIHTKLRDGETEEQHHKRHQQYVHQILDKLKENDLYLKPEKCTFEQTEIDYLGVIVSPPGAMRRLRATLFIKSKHDRVEARLVFVP